MNKGAWVGCLAIAATVGTTSCSRVFGVFGYADRNFVSTEEAQIRISDAQGRKVTAVRNFELIEFTAHSGHSDCDSCYAMDTLAYINLDNNIVLVLGLKSPLRDPHTLPEETVEGNANVLYAYKSETTQSGELRCDSLPVAAITNDTKIAVTWRRIAEKRPEDTALFHPTIPPFGDLACREAMKAGLHNTTIGGAK